MRFFVILLHHHFNALKQYNIKFEGKYENEKISC